MSYKCNFLWPYEDDSWESFIYGIANANTEEYAEAIWEEMKEKLTTITEERDALKVENENLLDRLGEGDKHCEAARAEDCPWMKRGKELEAERDRYREALNAINDHYVGITPPSIIESLFWAIKDIVRTAIKEKS